MFPLPGVVLFPGSMIPLQVFEPRYREMMQSVLEHPTPRLVIAHLKPGYADEYLGRPAVFPVAGLGEVIASEKLEDGRYHILVRGVRRVEILRERPPTRSFREVDCRPLVEAPTDPARLRAGHRRLVSLCDALAPLLGEDGDALRGLCRSELEPALLADMLTAGFIGDDLRLQSLLENLDGLQRIEAVCEQIARRIVEEQPRGRPN